MVKMKTLKQSYRRHLPLYLNEFKPLMKGCNIHSDNHASQICHLNQNCEETEEVQVVTPSKDNQNLYDMNRISDFDFSFFKDLPEGINQSEEHKPSCDQIFFCVVKDASVENDDDDFLKKNQTSKNSRRMSILRKVKKYSTPVSYKTERYHKVYNDDANIQKRGKLTSSTMFSQLKHVQMNTNAPKSPSSTATTILGSPTSTSSSISEKDEEAVFESSQSVSSHSKKKSLVISPHKLKKSFIEKGPKKMKRRINKYTNQIQPHDSHVVSSYMCYQNGRSYMEDRLVIKSLGNIMQEHTSCILERKRRLRSRPCRAIDNKIKYSDDSSSDSALNSSISGGEIDDLNNSVFESDDDIEDLDYFGVEDNRASMYAVFDGHGGKAASQFCCDNFCSYLKSDESFPHNLYSALESTFDKIDKDFISTGQNDGTTACVCILVGRHKVVCGNAGDSRAIVVRSNGSVAPLSRDHKPSTADESKRIRNLGGKIVYRGRWRVEGLLSVSRGIGDVLLKPYLSSQPDIYEYDLDNEDIFLIVATDGIWDVIDNEQVYNILAGKSNAAGEGQLVNLARVLCDCAKKRGSNDNLSAVVVDLRSFGEI